MLPSVRRSSPSLTKTCSSAVYDTRRRRAGGAPDSHCSPLRGWRLAVGLRRFPAANYHRVGICSRTPQHHRTSDFDYPNPGRPRSLAAHDDGRCDLAVMATSTAAHPRRRPPPRRHLRTHPHASLPTPMLTPVYPLERIPAHRRQRRCTRLSVHPQLAATHGQRAGMVLLRARRHIRRSRYPWSSPHRGAHAAPFIVQDLARRSHHPR